MQYKRISADCHLDLPWLPADLFMSETTHEFKDRLPKVVEYDDGLRWETGTGVKFGLKNGVSPMGAVYVRGKNARLDKIADTGIFDDGKKGICRVGDPDLRVKDMNRDGVDAEVIFGLLGVAPRLKDDAAAREMFRIYNDWIKDFCSHYPDRHIGLALLPSNDVDAAVKEIYRVAKMGSRGVELSCSWEMQPLWHEIWEPFWKAVNDVGLPLHFHAIPADVPADITDPLRRSAALFTNVTRFQMRTVDLISGLIGANVLERYPNIRVAFAEIGTGWLPYALDRMDFNWEDRFKHLGLKMKPSDYWRRQCRASFQFDPIGSRLIDDIGAESLMWGSDFPHIDGVWPDSTEFIEKQFVGAPAHIVKQITCDNAVKFYRLAG